MLSLLAAAFLMSTEFPETTITNGEVTAKLYLPDAEHGYYRGTRFDWAGVIPSLTYKGHSYFGVWFDKYDPLLHDAISGPVEEFFHEDAALGYKDATVGGTFVRIGVGALRKPQEEKFNRFKTYDVVDHGKWTIHKHKDSVEFVHMLTDMASGYAYEYHKTVRLLKGSPILEISHMLRNRGSQAIVTDVYNHNFFVIDEKKTADGLSVTFPFAATSKASLNGMAEMRSEGKELAFLRELTQSEHVMTELTGYSATSASDHTFKVDNRVTGAGVKVTGDQPMSKLLFWCGWKVASPEDYITMSIGPGQSFRWSNKYEFYSSR